MTAAASLLTQTLNVGLKRVARHSLRPNAHPKSVSVLSFRQNVQSKRLVVLSFRWNVPSKRLSVLSFRSNVPSKRLSRLSLRPNVPSKRLSRDRKTSTRDRKTSDCRIAARPRSHVHAPIAPETLVLFTQSEPRAGQSVERAGQEAGARGKK